MNKYVQMNNQGNLFYNAHILKKNAHKGWPKLVGNALIDGVWYKTPAWQGRQTNGSQFYKVHYQRMTDRDIRLMMEKNERLDKRKATMIEKTWIGLA